MFENSPATTLNQLRPGDSATIESVDDHDEASRRILALGFVPGSIVRVVRCAPLGDPVELEVGGSRFGLRRSESTWIRVRRHE